MLPDSYRIQLRPAAGPGLSAAGGKCLHVLHNSTRCVPASSAPKYHSQSGYASLAAQFSSAINRAAYPGAAKGKNVLKARRCSDVLVTETAPSALVAEEVVKEGWVSAPVF